jgi:hypothetical protein
MNRQEMNDAIKHYRAGFDDAFYLGEVRDGYDIDTHHPAYRAGYDHGIFQYCETIEEAA